MMKKILIALIALAFATLACSVFVGGPDLSYHANSGFNRRQCKVYTIKFSQAAATGAATGTVTLNIT